MARFPRLRRDSGESIEAMCRAAVFGDSGPSRSLLYAVLAKATAIDEDRRQIKRSLEDMQAIIARNSPYMDLSQARHRLFALGAALNLDDDLRMRVERADVYSGRIDDLMTPDERCADEAHRWGALREVLRDRESVVVVCPRAGRDGRAAGCATLALDFHKVAQLTAPDTEGFLLTESAKRLHRVKYRGNAADVSSIASELAGIISSHPLYAKAETIAVVIGRRHDASVWLGTEAARLAGKSAITFALLKEPAAGPEFMLTEPDLVRDQRVIIIDDVYRTGNTLHSAAQLLRAAGARQVLGLTVTCTVSAMIPP